MQYVRYVARYCCARASPKSLHRGAAPGVFGAREANSSSSEVTIQRGSVAGMSVQVLADADCDMRARRLI